MTKKLIAITFTLALAIGGAVYAQEPGKEDNQENKFSERKAEMVKELNAEKTNVEQVLSCVNSAQKQDDMKKCHDLKKANMEKMHAERRATRKEHLQDELKKIDAEDKNSKK